MGVYAISPELGDDEHGSEYFFIKSEKGLKKVITQNYVWIERTFARLFPMVIVTEKHARLLGARDGKVEVETVLRIENQGLDTTN